MQTLCQKAGVKCQAQEWILSLRATRSVLIDGTSRASVSKEGTSTARRRVKLPLLNRSPSAGGAGRSEDVRLLEGTSVKVTKGGGSGTSAK